MENCFSLLVNKLQISAITEAADQSRNYDSINLFFLEGFDNLGEYGLSNTRFLLTFIRRSDQI